MIFLPPVPVPVTIDVRAASLSQALPKLGEAFGVRMKASPAIGHETLILALLDVPLDRFKSRIAETFAAEWRTEPDGTLILAPSQKLRRQEERASKSRHDGGIAAALGTFRTRWAQNEPVTQAGLDAAIASSKRDPKAKGEGSQAKERVLDDPERRFALRILSALTPADFAAVETRTVLSSRPNPRQRPFPLDLGPIAKTYLDESRAMRLLNDRSEGTAPPVAPIANVLLSIEHLPNDVSLRLSAFDGAGAELFARRIVLDVDGTARDWVEVAGQTAAFGVESPTYDGPKVVLALSPESRAYAKLFGTGSSWIAGERPPIASFAPYLDVQTRDPLSFAASDVVLGLARAIGSSVLMRGFDEAIVAGGLGERTDPVTVEEALGTRNVDRSHAGWILIGPDDPVAAAATRFPRADLAKALRLGAGAPEFPIETQIEVARLVPRTIRYVTLASFIERLGRMNGTPSLYNARTLRLLGAIGGVSPRTIRFRDLSPEERAGLEELIYGVFPIAFTRTAEATVALSAAVESEPTLFLPVGLPPNGELRIERDEADAVLLADADGYEETLEPDRLAATAFRAKYPGLFPNEGPSRSDFSRIRRVARTTTVLRIHPRPGYERKILVRSQAPVLDAPFALENLPPDLKHPFDVAWRALELRYRNAPSNEGGRMIPPP